MQKILIATAVIFLCVIGYFLIKSEPSITNYPPQEGVLVAFGDSLVFGTGASPGKDFVSLLETRVGEPIINRGVPGDTTESALLRIDEVLTLRPRIALVLLGGNDYLRRVPSEETFANLEAIITRLQEKGVLVVLLGIRGGILRDNFENSFEALATKTGAAYVPNVLDGLVGDAALMSDEIHPNDAGYALIARKVYEVLAPVLH